MNLQGRWALTKGAPWAVRFFFTQEQRLTRPPARFEIADALVADLPPFIVVYAVSTATGHIVIDDAGITINLSATETGALGKITAAKYRMIVTDAYDHEYIWRHGRLAINENESKSTGNFTAEFPHGADSGRGRQHGKRNMAAPGGAMRIYKR